MVNKYWLSCQEGLIEVEVLTSEPASQADFLFLTQLEIPKCQVKRKACDIGCNWEGDCGDDERVGAAWAESNGSNIIHSRRVKSQGNVGFEVSILDARSSIAMWIMGNANNAGLFRKGILAWIHPSG